MSETTLQSHKPPDVHVLLVSCGVTETLVSQ